MGESSTNSKTNIPQHVAVIMDGNGRWAKKQGMMRILGHKHAIKAVRDTVEAAAEMGVKFLTLYAFSTENWNRPAAEVKALMELLVTTILDETPTLQKNKIRLQTIGDVNSLPEASLKSLNKAMDDTAHNTHMTLVLALSYSSKWEMVQAIKNIGFQIQQGSIKPEEITEQTISSHLQTSAMPDPELIIRTSGEHRISNFLLWQGAYSEFYFTETLWPDFRKADFAEAIKSYQQRERRFGLVSEQINK